MKSLRFLFLRALGCVLVSTCVYAQVPTAVWTGRIDEREYLAANGRRVRISSMGNVVSFQSAGGQEHINVKRSREGYVLAYKPTTVKPVIVIHDVHDSYSDIISRGYRDFIPETFTFPNFPAGTPIPSDTLLKATAVVKTRDGKIRLTHVMVWRAGYGPISIGTEIANISTMQLVLVAYKRHTDPDVAKASTNDFVLKGDGAVAFRRACLPIDDCPPPCRYDNPECDPTRQGVPLFQVRGDPPPSYQTFKRFSDDSELTSSGLVTTGDLGGYRMDEDNQVTLAWTMNAVMTPGQTKYLTVSLGQ